jgi:hypothetical protein
MRQRKFTLRAKKQQLKYRTLNNIKEVGEQEMPVNDNMPSGIY